MSFRPWRTFLWTLLIGLFCSVVGSAQSDMPSVLFGSGSADTAISWYIGAPLRIPVSLIGSSYSLSAGEIQEVDGRTYFVWEHPPIGSSEVIIAARDDRGRVVEGILRLTVEKPILLERESRRIRYAGIGSWYKPSTFWASAGIAPEDYRTIVYFGEEKVFDRRGTGFVCASYPVINPESGPIRMTVYWLPGGDTSASGLVPILTTDPSVVPIIAEYKLDEIWPRYKAPVYDGTYSFRFLIDGKKWDVDFDNIIAKQNFSGSRTEEGIDTLIAECPECSEFGIGQPTVVQTGEYTWRLHIEVLDKEKVIARRDELNGRDIGIDLTLIGRGSNHGVVTIQMKLRVCCF